MSTKKTVMVTNRQQLIDLNGEMINFDLTFTATSKNKEPFDILVVDQTTLDNNPKLEYKRANGVISANIISDKNVYQNYFLCIKADNPCEVDVVIEKKEISPNLSGSNNTVPSQNELQQSGYQNVPEPSVNVPNMHGMLNMQNSSQMLLPPRQSSTNWKLVLIVIVLLVGGYALYTMYTKQDSSIKSSFGNSSDTNHFGSEADSVASSTNFISSKNFGFPATKKSNNDLISRLNNISIR
jgi:hypothetical protein